MMSSSRWSDLLGLLLGGLVTLVTLVTLDASAHPGSGIVVEARGRVHFVETGGGVYRIDGPGRLTRLPGPAFHWMTVDDAGLFARTTLPSTSDAEMVSVGRDPTIVLSSDWSLVVSQGALFFPQLGGDGHVRICRLAPDGRQTVHATLPAHTESGPLKWLGGLAAGPDGSLYYTEVGALRRIAKDGTLRTVASAVEVPGCVRPPGYAPDSGPDLRGLAVAPDGTAYVAASGCGALLRVSPGGEVVVVLRTKGPWSPTGVALAGGAVHVLEYLHTASDERREWLPRVRRLERDGGASTLAAIDHR